MKKFKLSMLVMFLLCITTCKKDGNGKENGDNNNKEEDELKVTPTELLFAADDATTRTITVATNVDIWSINQSVSWIILEKEADDKFSVAVKKSELVEARTGVITVKAGEANPVNITVKQAAVGEEVLSALPTELDFTVNDTRKQIVTVYTNVDNWDISTLADWLIVNKESDDEFSVKVEINERVDERTENITITAGHAKPVWVKVKQLGIEKKLSVDKDNLVFTAVDYQEQTVVVTTNVNSWIVVPSDNWIIIDKESDKFSVEVLGNPNTSERTGTITVTADGVSVTITITQLANDRFDWSLDPELKELKAFPGAEGFGSLTTGGRGGRVLYVTTLEDGNTPGTFRYAVTQSGPRIIMFKVAGRIKLNSRLDIRNGNLTIAGHSAPGDGICISDYSVVVSASNVIVRHMRFRMGDEQNFEDDAFWGRYQTNLIIDHCSMSWSVDECSSFYNNENFTMQWCILSESLRISAHEKGAHGYGGIWGGKKASFHHNLLAHHDSRNPRFAAYDPNSTGGAVRLEGLVDFRNNVIFNWGGNSGYGGEGGNYNMVNNYYQPGSASGNSARIFAPDPDGTAGGLRLHGVFYVAGNIMMNSNGTVNTSVTNNNWLGIHPNSSIQNPNNVRSDVEFDKGQITTHTAQEAYELVLANAGANFSRDATDARIVNETRNILTPTRAYFTLNPSLRPPGINATRAGMIDTQADVGGWVAYNYNPVNVPVDTDGDGIPDEWEIANGLNPNDPTDGPKNTLTRGTYTNLEVYLYSLLITK